MPLPGVTCFSTTVDVIGHAGRSSNSGRQVLVYVSQGHDCRSRLSLRLYKRLEGPAGTRDLESVITVTVVKMLLKQLRDLTNSVSPSLPII